MTTTSSAPDPSAPEKVRGHCPECGPNRWAIVLGEFVKHEDSGGIWTDTTYRMLQCPACDEVYFQTDHVFSEDYSYDEGPSGEMEVEYHHKIEHWPYNPPSARERPVWIDKLIRRDEDIHSLMESVYSALENDLSVLAAIGIRTVFDRASELLGVDPSKSFANKLAELESLGKIGSDQRQTLEVLTDAGSAAAHRGCGHHRTSWIR